MATKIKAIAKASPTIKAPASTPTASDASAMPSHAIAAIKGVSAEASARREAFGAITDLVYSEASLRADVINALAIALGKAPTLLQMTAARNGAIAGRIAARLAAADLPVGVHDKAGRLALGHAIVTGDKAAKRPAYAKAYGAAREYWSKLLAETGHGLAKPQDVKNASKKTPAAPAPAPAVKGTPAPELAKHVPAPAPLPPIQAKTRGEAIAYVTQQATAMLFYAKKNAKVMPTDLYKAIQEFVHASADVEAAMKLEGSANPVTASGVAALAAKMGAPT